jgi:hypothetical protein
LKQNLLSGELYEDDHESCIEPYDIDDVDLWDFLCEVQRRMLRRVRLLQRFGLLPRPSELGLGDQPGAGDFFPGPGLHLSES